MIINFKVRENAWVEIAKAQVKKTKEREYNKLCEVLKPFLEKKIKVHGMLFIRRSDDEEKGRYSIFDALIISSSKEVVPVSIGNIKVDASEKLFKNRLEGHSGEYYEFKGIFSEREQKYIEFKLISARKLSRTERKRVQQMN